MKKILVGFDGSEGSEQALNRALSLIDEFGELILLAVIPSKKDRVFVDENMYQKMKKRAQVLLDDAIRDFGTHELEVRGIVEEGDAAAKIIDVANRERVDLIVLGSRGTTEIGQYLLGSIANKVVQYAHKPVMVVR